MKTSLRGGQGRGHQCTTNVNLQWVLGMGCKSVQVPAGAADVRTDFGSYMDAGHSDMVKAHPVAFHPLPGACRTWVMAAAAGWVGSWACLGTAGEVPCRDDHVVLDRLGQTSERKHHSYFIFYQVSIHTFRIYLKHCKQLS